MSDGARLIEFDHHAREHSDRWLEQHRELRANCPVARTEAHGGYWVVSRYDDVGDIARAPELFSSAKWRGEDGSWMGGNTLPTIEGRIIPDETDPPEWKMFRHLLNPFFTPKSIAKSKELAEVAASCVVDAVIEKGRCDMVYDLSTPLPTIMTLHMMGLPIEQWREYAEPEHEAIFNIPGTPDYAKAVEGLQWGEREMEAAFRARRGGSGDDLLTHIANGSNDDGEPFTDSELLDICRQVLGGGADTTTSLLANVFAWLSDNPNQRQRLIDDPSLEGPALEEFLRYFAPIHSSIRRVTRPTELHGVAFSPEDKVLISYASANRDEAYFEDPDVVKLDRFPNPHIGFGVGIHRCLGSHMARQSYFALTREVLRRMPDFRVLKDEAEQYKTIGVVNGWVSMPAVFTPGRRENRDPALFERLRLERA
jgi:cytochrome P450